MVNTTIRGFLIRYSGLIPRPLGHYNKIGENRLGKICNTALLAAGIENFRFEYLYQMFF